MTFDRYGLRRLVAAVLKHAYLDWVALEEKNVRYVDEDHQSYCRRNDFDTGKLELDRFFKSRWCARLCDELDLRDDDLRDIVGVEHPGWYYERVDINIRKN